MRNERHAKDNCGNCEKNLIVLNTDSFTDHLIHAKRCKTSIKLLLYPILQLQLVIGALVPKITCAICEHLFLCHDGILQKLSS